MSSKTGQSFTDRMNAAKHSVSGSGIAKIVCKATTEELAAPKKKHLDYLVKCTFEPNVSIPEMVNLLVDRTQQVNWVVAFKSLITIHNTMNYGNERFCQYFSTNNCHHKLSNFIDRTAVQAYDMCKFVRKYCRYVEQKIKSYRDIGFDFCKIKRGKENGVMRKLSVDKLLKSISVLETQLDSMLDFDAKGTQIHHPIIYSAFLLLYKDAIRLFATYNDSMINLIEKYFSMNRKQCRDALKVYKGFTKRIDRVDKFLRLAEEIGFGNNEKLELQPVPPTVLEALENHLNQMDGLKDSDIYSSGSVLSLTNSKTTKAQSSDFSNFEKQKIIDEENNKLKEFAARKSIDVDLFTIPKSEAFINTFDANQFSKRASLQITKNKPSDDLIMLGLDPDPQEATFNSNISTEVADIFGVSSNYSVPIRTPNNNPFVTNSSVLSPLKSEIDRNFDTIINTKDTSTNKNKSLVSLDDNLLSFSGNLDIVSPKTRNSQINATSVNWDNLMKSSFEQSQPSQVRPGSMNMNMTNNYGTMNPLVQQSGGYGVSMQPMQNYQGDIMGQHAQMSYNSNVSSPLYYGGYGQQHISHNPPTIASNNPYMSPMSFQSQNPYSSPPNTLF